METKNIKKRIVSISVATSLLLSSTPASAADSLSQMFNGSSYSNTTNGGTWSDSLNGGRYMYGGSYQFRYKESPRATSSIITIQPPSIKAGCHGISISGGFLSLLGLSDLSDQLQNAGQSVAWGVVIGLVYSLPGVMHAFQTIQQWARLIQTLLQNACHFGTVLGQALGNSVEGAAKDYFKDTPNIEIADSIKNSSSYKAIQEYTVSPDKAVAAIDAEIRGWFKNSLPTNNPAANGAFKHLIGKAIMASSGGVAHVVANTANASDINSQVKLYKGTLSELVNSHTIDGNSGIKLSSFTDSDALNIELLLTFFGDLIGNGEVCSASDALYYNAIETVNGQAKANVVGKAAEQYKVTSFTLSDPVIANVKEAAKALMYGFSQADTSSYCASTTQDQCNIPDRPVYAAVTAIDMTPGDAQVNSDGNVMESGLGSTTTTTYKINVWIGQENGGKIPFTWSGFYNQSHSAIRQIVEARRAGQPIPDLSSIQAPLLLPSMGKYLKVIIIEMTKNNIAQIGDSAYIGHLVDMLARYNSYFAAQDLISRTRENALKLFRETGQSSGSGDGGAYSLAMKNIETRAEAINAEILKEHANDISYHDLTEVFEKIEHEQQVDVKKSSPSK